MPESYLEDGADKVSMQLRMLTEHIEEKGIEKGYYVRNIAKLYHADNTKRRHLLLQSRQIDIGKSIDHHSFPFCDRAA